MELVVDLELVVVDTELAIEQQPSFRELLSERFLQHLSVVRTMLASAATVPVVD